MAGPMGLEAVSKSLRYIPLSHDATNSEPSARKLVTTLFPEWEQSPGNIEFIRFTDGITNTLLKAVKHRPRASQAEIDAEAVLIRAYGRGTEVLIDRERETLSHVLLADSKLAPRLLARFRNGMMYRFIPGGVCTYTDLTTAPIYKAVAHRLGEWHAVLPVVSTEDSTNGMQGDREALTGKPLTPNKPAPNIWTVIQKWVLALPASTPAEQKRNAMLLKELERSVVELADTPGLGHNGLTFSHCDLLSGNVIVTSAPSEPVTVSFIDYEYATPAPPAFDIANHFAEWGGLHCDYAAMPTRSQRRAFIHAYLESYYSHRPMTSLPVPAPSTQSSGTSPRSSSPSNLSSPPSTHPSSPSIASTKVAAVVTAPKSSLGTVDLDAEVERLMAEVDAFRGIPGLYWGVWALIQAEISTIDFDYIEFARLRLGEYWAWRASNGEGGPEIAGLDKRHRQREARWTSD